MTRSIAAALAFLLGAAASTGAARAQEIDATPLSLAELAELRGGFLLPTGIEAEFGAIARTFSNGALVLETHFTWSPDGIARQDVLASSDIVSTDQLANGFALNDASGSTLFAHQVDDLGIRNILLNEASGRDIRIDTQLTVTLPNFALSQQSFSDALLAVHLFDDIQAGP
jgi:hypothetical protein